MEVHVASKHLAADVAVALDVSGREYLVVVAKATWSIPEPGQRARPLPPQAIVLSDEFHGAPGESAMRYGADMARFKPRCDIIFDAFAHAPGGQAVKEMTVGFEIGSLVRQVRVIGVRHWQGQGNDPKDFRLSEPEAFVDMPLHHGLAFGGARWYEHDGQRLCEAHLANPVGLGFGGPATARQLIGQQGPRIESLESRVKTPADAPSPQALGAVARHWSPRRELCGTHDEQWRRDVFPLLPVDFDEAFNQTAPTEQQLPYLRGGEQVRLRHLVKGHSELSFRLPQLPLDVRVLRNDYEEIIATPVVDTIFFETEKARFSVCWRASVPLRRSLQEISDVAIGPVDPLWWRERTLGGSGAGCRGCNEPTSTSRPPFEVTG